MSDLKPCPFCGEEEDLHVYEYGKGTDNCDCFVQCQGCSATGRASETDRQGAIDNWNRRTQPEATKPAAPELPGCLADRLYEAISIAYHRASYAGSTQRMKKWDATAADLRAALASSANALSAGDRVDAALLQKLRDYVGAKSQEYGYGFYRPANPHDFTPDADQCSEGEIAAHKAACEAFDKGEYTYDHSGCIQGGGMHILHAPWGIGSYVMRDEESVALLAAIDAAILQSQKSK